MDRRNVDMIAAATPSDNGTWQVKRGEKHYELSNHLGNVLATVSDKKIAVMNGANLSYYRADVVSYSDYYPFGAPMTERTASLSDVRYGFQGQEEDNELWNGAVSFKYRVEDSRLGRFFSVDPKLKEYPWNSTYAFSENRLLDAVELEGLEAWKINAEWDQCYIEAYRSQVKQIITIAQASGIRFTCEDLAIHVLISFASSNGLPVVFQNGTGTYFSGDKTFTNTEEFKNKVQITSGARDLLKSTTKVDPEKLRPGDLILLDTHDSGTINHTQVVIDNNSTQTNIAQGNFVSDWEILTELRISEDPNSKYYLGTFIQRGSYDNQSGNYQRNGEVTESLLCKSTTIPSEWDFNWFNEYTKFHDYFESLKKSSESSDAPVPTVPNNKSDCHGN